MAMIWQAFDNVEPIADSTIESIANMATYSVAEGCAQTYSASDMVKTVAAGTVYVDGALVAVAGNTVTLVSDPTNPRWTWTYIPSSGTAAIVSGDPAAAPSVPELGNNTGIGLDLVQAAQTIAGDITYQIDKRVFSAGPTVIYRWKSATQVLTTTTTFTPVTAAVGTSFKFRAEVNGVYDVTYWIPLAFGGTGGVKFQLTGPAAPTSVDITGWRTLIGTAAFDVVNDTLAVATSFSSDIAAANSRASLDAENQYYSGAAVVVCIKARIINGATAGDVVLEVAQNSSNSTTTVGIGATMEAKRIG